MSRRSVERYVKRAEAGRLAASPHPGSKPWLSAEQGEVLRHQVEAHNDSTLEEHAQALAEATGVQLKKSAIDKYFRKLGISRKKRASTQQSETS